MGNSGFFFLMSCLYSCNRLSYYFCTDKWACCQATSRQVV